MEQSGKLHVSKERLWQRLVNLMIVGSTWTLLLTVIPEVVVGETTPRFETILSGTNATVGQGYNGTTNNKIQLTYLYMLESHDGSFENSSVRLTVQLNKTDSALLHGLHVSITQPSDKSVSFRLPPVEQQNGMLREDNSTEYIAERTICILDQKDISVAIPLTIVFSTKSDKNISFDMIVTDSQGYLLTLGKNKTVVVSPSTPQSLGFLFEKSINSVVILANAENNNDTCMTLSIQTPVCPIFDQEENIHYEGIFQTITSSGALLIQKTGPFHKGFIVVIIAHSNNTQCLQRDPFSLPFPNLESAVRLQAGTSVTIQILNREIPGKIFFWSIPVLATTTMAIILLVILCLRHRYIRSHKFQIEARNSWMGIQINKLLIENFSHVANCSQTDFSNLVSTVGVFYCIPVIQFALYIYQVSYLTGDSDMCYYNYRCAHPFFIFLDFNHIVSNLPYVIFGGMTVLFAKYHKSKLENHKSELRNRADLEQSSRVRPTISSENTNGSTNQSRLLNDPHEMQNTGELNQHISEGNSIMQAQPCTSNLPVVDRAPMSHNGNSSDENLNASTESLLPPAHQDESNQCNCASNLNDSTQGLPEFGVPFHYDMFKALGFSLIFEGILSASYHLCPNEATFQFDTCFMYVIALTTIIHLYQARHPHCFKAKYAFMTLAFIVIPTVVSIASNFLSFTITTTFMSFIIVITCSVNVFVGLNYSLLETSTDRRVAPLNFFRMPKVTSNQDGNGNNIYRFRLILPAGCIVISLLVDIYWMISRCKLSTFMLYLLVGNMCWNIFYYVFMKFVHGELTLKRSVFPIIYLSLAMMFGVTAVSFYLDVAARWELPPSASRAVNQECQKMFGTEIPFDSHDIWHILSATAIFCIFNLLLTLDDDLIATPTEKISVF